MAYRSSGTNNDEMVDNLKRFGVIRSTAVEEGFRAVDRKHFVPRNRPEMAHADQPLKEGNIHISAPHIYGSVVESLDLTAGQSHSFLNLGSGTGYLTCIVAAILGPTCVCYGVDVFKDVVEYGQESIDRWKAARSADASSVGVEFPPIVSIHGNALHIDSSKGEAATGFDRIYIGASVDKRNLASLASMLRPGGVMVGPVDDELVKVVRIGTEGSTSQQTSPPRSFRGRSIPLSADFSMQVTSSVRFSRLLPSPPVSTIIPSKIWDPSNHRFYPESFRRSCKEILLCSTAPSVQPLPPKADVSHVNVAATLPRAIWMEIFSYARRDWFEQPKSQEELLRRRLVEEQAAAQRAHEARIEAEARLHMVERERDIYRLLALRWQSRLQALANANSGSAEDGDDIAVDDDVFLDEFTQVAAAGNNRNDPPIFWGLGNLGSMIRRFQSSVHNGVDDDDDDDDDDEEEQGDQMDEQADMDEETETDDDITAMDDVAAGADQVPQDILMGASTLSTQSANRIGQIRTISISSDNLSA